MGERALPTGVRAREGKAAGGDDRAVAQAGRGQRRRPVAWKARVPARAQGSRSVGGGERREEGGLAPGVSDSGELSVGGGEERSLAAREEGEGNKGVFG